MLRSVLCSLAFVAGVGGAAVSAGGAEPVAVIDVRVDPVVATVGDRLTLTVLVEHEPGTEITGPDQDADYGQAVFIAARSPATQATGVRARTTLSYTLTSFTVGKHEIPPLAIEYVTGAERGTVVTPAAPYTTDSVLPPDTTTLRPLKPQLSIPEPAPPPFVPGTFVALLAVLTVLGYWLMRRALDSRPVVLASAPIAPVMARDPAEVAREALASLAESGLAARDVAEYYARIAGTVRQYLSARWGIPAYAMTRREIERGMAASGLERWPARLAANLLEQCEAAEFAKFVPARERREQDLATGYEIIRLSEPEAESADETAAD